MPALERWTLVVINTDGRIDRRGSYLDPNRDNDTFFETVMDLPRLVVRKLRKPNPNFVSWQIFVRYD